MCLWKRSMLLNIHWSVCALLTFKCPSQGCYNANLCSFKFDCINATNSTPCTLKNLMWYKLLTSSMIATSSQMEDKTKQPSSLNSICKCFEPKCRTNRRFAFNLHYNKLHVLWLWNMTVLSRPEWYKSKRSRSGVRRVFGGNFGLWTTDTLRK